MANNSCKLKATFGQGCLYIQYCMTLLCRLKVMINLKLPLEENAPYYWRTRGRCKKKHAACVCRRSLKHQARYKIMERIRFPTAWMIKSVNFFSSLTPISLDISVQPVRMQQPVIFSVCETIATFSDSVFHPHPQKSFHLPPKNSYYKRSYHRLFFLRYRECYSLWAWLRRRLATANRETFTSRRNIVGKAGTSLRRHI